MNKQMSTLPVLALGIASLGAVWLLTRKAGAKPTSDPMYHVGQNVYFADGDQEIIDALKWVSGGMVYEGNGITYHGQWWYRFDLWDPGWTEPYVLWVPEPILFDLNG